MNMNTRGRRITIAVLGAVLLFITGLIRPSLAQMGEVQSSAANSLLTHTASASVENVVAYEGYAYGSWKTSEQKGYAVLSKNNLGSWDISCERSQDYLPIDMVRLCDVPVPIARHLYTLREDGEGEYRAAEAG